jgi:hypothetical protein
MAVRSFLAQLKADEIDPFEEFDDSAYVGFKCLDPNGLRVETYYERC